jgi:hypothetical protein
LIEFPRPYLRRGESARAFDARQLAPFGTADGVAEIAGLALLLVAPAITLRAVQSRSG